MLLRNLSVRPTSSSESPEMKYLTVIFKIRSFRLNSQRKSFFFDKTFENCLYSSMLVGSVPREGKRIGISRIRAWKARAWRASRVVGRVACSRVLERQRDHVNRGSPVLEVKEDEGAERGEGGEGHGPVDILVMLEARWGEEAEANSPLPRRRKAWSVPLLCLRLLSSSPLLSSGAVLAFHSAQAQGVPLGTIFIKFFYFSGISSSSGRISLTLRAEIEAIFRSSIRTYQRFRSTKFTQSCVKTIEYFAEGR